jgi:hypothetical protein
MQVEHCKDCILYITEFFVVQLISFLFQIYLVLSPLSTSMSNSWSFDCLQLPECLRIVAHLRRIGVFSESELRLQVF